MRVGKARKNELNISVALSYLCLFANVIGSLMVTPILVRQLGSAEYGLYMLAYSVGMYVNVDGMGIGGVVVRQVKKTLMLGEKQERESFLFQSLIIFAALALISYGALRIIGLCSSALFAKSVPSESIRRLQWMLRLTAINCGLMFFVNLVTSVITGYDKLIFVKGVTLLKIVVRTLAVIAMIGFLRVEMLVLLDLAITGVVLAGSLLYAVKALGIRLRLAMDKTLFRETFRRTGFVFVSLVSDNVCWNSGSMMVAMFFGEASAGVYSIAMTLCGVFSQFSASISGLFLPGITGSVVGQTAPKALVEKMIQTGKYLMALLVWIILGFGLVGKEFLLMYLGADFLPAYAIALPLMIALLYPATQLVGDSIIQAMNKFNMRSTIQLLSSITSIGLGLWLIPRLGLAGSWVGLVTSVVIFRIIVTNIYLGKLGLNMSAYFWKTVPRMALIAATLVPALSWLFRALNMGFMLKCLVVTGAYALALWFGYLDHSNWKLRRFRTAKGDRAC